MDEELEGGRDGRRGEQRQGGKMDREEEVSGGMTSGRRERWTGGQSGDEMEAGGDGRDAWRERSVVSDRTLPAPRAGEGR